MRRAWSSGLVLMICAIAAGRCGGSLTGGAGGAGGSGAARGGASGGMTGPGGTSSGGSPYEGSYYWGGVTVQVAPGPTSTVTQSFELVVTDPAVPNQQRTLTFASTTTWSPPDGAYVGAHYGGCGTTAVYQVDVYSCAQNGVAGGTTTPGCIGIIFSERGVTGNFMDTDGTSCVVSNAGSAFFSIPPPDLRSRRRLDRRPTLRMVSSC